MNPTAQIKQGLLTRFPELIICREAIGKAFSVLRQCYAAGGKVLVCGNGGSAADAEHITAELMKEFQLNRRITLADREKLQQTSFENIEYLANHLHRTLPTVSLVSQAALLSAVSNDLAFDMVYAQQVYGYARPGDTLVAISTSGNSPNIVNAVIVANAFGVNTIGLTGETGGRLHGLCHVLIAAPAKETYLIQEYHLPIYHTLCAMLEAEFFSEPEMDTKNINTKGTKITKKK